MELERRRGEFSRYLSVDQLGPEPQEVSISATPDERAALARRFSLLSLAELSSRLRVARLGGGSVVRVDGAVTAEVEQSCVVTLEPVRSRVARDFRIDFVETPETPVAGTVNVDPDEEDWEAFVGEGIDLGEVVAEQLALSLDPYPRRPGVALADRTDLPSGTGIRAMTEEEAAEASNPFAVLKRRKE